MEMQTSAGRWWRSLVFLLVVTYLLTPCLGVVVPPSELRIAYISSLSPNSTTAVQFGHSGLAAFRLAVAQVNSQSAAWRANNSRPQPRFWNTTIVPLWFDGDNTAAASVNAAYDAATNGVVAIVGDYSSTPAQMIQYVCARAKIPQVSPGASIDEFTQNHFSTYPFFMRLVPQIAQQAAQMAAAIRRTFKWTRVAVIYGGDAFGTGGAVAFAKAAGTEGINILAQVSFTVGGLDFSFEIDRLVSSEARIFVYWGLAADLINFLRAIKAGFGAGRNPDLLGEGYQFVLCHGGVSKALYTDGTGNPITDILPWLPGLIGMQYYLNTSAPMWQYFEKIWRAQPYSPLTPSVTFTDTPPSDAGRAYDATMIVIRGLAWMYGQKVDPVRTSNRVELYNAIRNRTGAGVSGPIQLDKVGDRIQPFGLFNFQQASGSFINIGVFDPNGTFSQFPAVHIEYMGSDHSVRPLDRFVRGVTEIPHTTRTTLLSLTWIILTGIGCMQILLFLTREQNVMRAASPLFLGLFLFGAQLLCASIIPRVLEGNLSFGDHPCVADLWLANLGYTLLVGALLVKTMRLASILHARQRNQLKTRVTDQKLLVGLGVLLLLESIVLLSLQYASPMTMRRSTYDSMNDYYACRAGGSGGEIPDNSDDGSEEVTTSTGTNEVDTIYLPVIIATRFALLIATAVMAFRTRTIPDAFNESKQLLVTVYNLLLLSALLPAIDGSLGRGKEVSLCAYSLLVLVISLSSVSIIFLPKLNTLYVMRREERQKEKRARELSTTGEGWHQGDGEYEENRTRANDDSPTDVSQTVGTITLEDHTGNTRILTQNAFPPMDRGFPHASGTGGTIAQGGGGGTRGPQVESNGSAVQLLKSERAPHSKSQTSQHLHSHLHPRMKHAHKQSPEYSRSPAPDYKTTSPSLPVIGRPITAKTVDLQYPSHPAHAPAAALMDLVELQYYNTTPGNRSPGLPSVTSSSSASSCGSPEEQECNTNNKLRVHLPRGEVSLSWIHPDSTSPSEIVTLGSSLTTKQQAPASKAAGGSGLRLHVSETMLHEFMDFLDWRRARELSGSAGVAPQQSPQPGEACASPSEAAPEPNAPPSQ
jgi:ABC-type branched-subunit amino acid transport system substrate-binding protein